MMYTENEKYVVMQECPMCHLTNKMEITLEQGDRVRRYWNREGLIQDLLSDFSPREREFVKSGYCFKCQEKLF